MHSLDARVKLILTLAFIIALNLTPQGVWAAYLLFLTITLASAVISHTGIGMTLRRSWIAIPFALAALPLIFTGPAPSKVYLLFHTLPLEISLPGLQRAISITLKSWISIQAAILFSATTRLPDLLTALRQLGLPALFVAILSLMRRYLEVITDEAARMLQARASRSAAALAVHLPGGSISWRARVTGGMAGSLLLRSMERSERVYNAMLSRGYNGDLPEINTQILSRKNQAVLALGICLFAILLALSYLLQGQVG
jgi:cobalt/nickel transport system permease protein